MKASVIFLLLLLALASPSLAAEPAVNPGTMDNFSLSGVSDKGKKNWDLQGKSADIGAQVIKLQDVESHMYGENSTVKLTADTGDFNRQQGQLHLEKDVVITTSSGATLTTDSLDWNKKNQTVSTDDPVNIEKQDIRITGQGARGRTDLNKVDLEKDVRVHITPQASPAQKDGQARAPAQGPVTITCEGPMQVDYQANIAVFNKHVVAKTVDCDLQSDVMVLLFTKAAGAAPPAGAEDTKGLKIDRITAKGNVVIRRGQDVSYCDEAVYTASDRKISLSGSPKLVIYSEDLNASPRN
jgi:LPS export ABC transporter protein LptC